MSWVWWGVALWVPLSVALALAVSRSIRIADDRERGGGPESGRSGESSAPSHLARMPREPV